MIAILKKNFIVSKNIFFRLNYFGDNFLIGRTIKTNWPAVSTATPNFHLTYLTFYLQKNLNCKMQDTKIIHPMTYLANFDVASVINSTLNYETS